ncbi:copper homeostasis protein CutC [Pseudoxanthomonas indica]|uniref:PF03932 family protein CutC n=1 Tax=Pseudoxanthomonas indica TaxID=428993 RepID=A0A1T5IME0_9GAMM|nr:copper homeostasis protein CutC [Pseudoxanthomonas indica]GGD52989.1 copper homeostasis protein CutC [Pseudoxanthomonas indica]SKC40123.1 copper homeostasis protein [Pseudoxanthomonas indica]
MSAPRRLLEVAANSLASALAAQAGGGDRVELCENLAEGGTTPSHGTLVMAREQLQIPLYVLIRPRPGDFHYDAQEVALMVRDIRHCRELGCDGVVIGALDAQGRVDARVCGELMAAASGMGVSFHRAIDASRDPLEALDAIIELGCERVLTSGAQASAEAGREVIAAMVRQAAGRIAILAGAGVTPGNVAALVRQTGVSEVHASAKAPRASTMAFRNPALQGLELDWQQSDAAAVRALRQALDRSD